MAKNTVLEPQFYSNIPDRNFHQRKRLVGPVLSISENLRSKGQRPSSPHDHIWAKLSFGSITPLKCIQWQLLSVEKSYGAVLSLSETIRVKGEGLQMTNAILEPYAHYKRDFCGPVSPRHIESTCRRRHPIDALAWNSV